MMDVLPGFERASDHSFHDGAMLILPPCLSFDHAIDHTRAGIVQAGCSDGSRYSYGDAALSVGFSSHAMPRYEFWINANSSGFLVDTGRNLISAAAGADFYNSSGAALWHASLSSSAMEHDGMPSRTKKQAKTMAAAAHNPAFAKKVGIPQSVAKDFNQADKGAGILKKKGKKGR